MRENAVPEKRRGIFASKSGSAYSGGVDLRAEMEDTN